MEGSQGGPMTAQAAGQPNYSILHKDLSRLQHTMRLSKFLTFLSITI
jgi:hypothetical protein